MCLAVITNAEETRLRRASMVLVVVYAASLTWGGEPTGTISGRVSYIGRVPPPLIVIESGNEQQVLEVEPKSHGLAHAVVFLDAEAEPALERLPPPPSIRAAGCSGPR